MLRINLDYRPRLADLRRVGHATGEIAAFAPLPAARRTSVESLQDRQGYQADFLGDFLVDWPQATDQIAHDVLQVTDTGSNRLDYTHFSVTMSKSRRLALVAGVNIDGAQLVDVARKSDRWAFDGRIPDDAQVGESLYSDNLLDRGHLVRRQDPNWGPNAAQANADTFHFTNCAPQMASFNQKNWLDLENYLLENTQRWRERVTVFTGPVFSAMDEEYRGMRIPKAYWKVVAFLGAEGKPSATGYMLDQSRDLERLEATFGRFRTYQRSILQIEQRTGIQFGDLSRFDGFSNEERATGTRIETELLSLNDVRV
jgi:endonuclease G